MAFLNYVKNEDNNTDDMWAMCMVCGWKGTRKDINERVENNCPKCGKGHCMVQGGKVNNTRILYELEKSND